MNEYNEDITTLALGEGGQTSKPKKVSASPKVREAMKKEKLKELWVAICLDESGSMISTQEKVISGFNEFLDDRIKDSESRTVRLWVNKFNTKTDMMVDGLKADSITKLTKETYSPKGWTALLDSVGETITTISARYTEAKVKPDVTFLIITDGQENQSKEYNVDQIKQMVLDREKNGWAIAYFGATLDNFSNKQHMAQAATLGRKGKQQTNTFTSHNMEGMFHANSRAIRSQSVVTDAGFAPYRVPTDTEISGSGSNDVIIETVTLEKPKRRRREHNS